MLRCLRVCDGWAARVHNPTLEVILVGSGLSSMFSLSKPATLEIQVQTFSIVVNKKLFF